ncbi:MAG: tryptophan synthase subunit alpha [Nitrospinota bacterium]|nr:tryptophan synthase subunit alpha [Nitrospinota bacterium]
MTRIGKRFKELNNRKALVAFLTAGDPDLDATKNIFGAIEKNGADIIEIGVPFTDPLADGPVILQSALRSLDGGTTLKKILTTVSEIRESSELPIVLMSSFNPVFVYGEKDFVDDAVRAGVDGVIIPDLPPEEAEELAQYAGKKGLDIIYLLAPTSTPGRVRMVARQSRGFIYYISLTGVTGTRTSLADGLQEKVGQIKKAAVLPVLIGFGISGPDQAKQAAKISDGVILGSAIMKIIEQTQDPTLLETQVGQFIASIKQAIS